MPRYTKRKLFTYEFKGRERRALLWRKSLYEEWFEYAKLYESLGGRVPRAFGKLGHREFEDWWRDEKFGFELFCEPVMGNLCEVEKDGKKRQVNRLLLSIDLVADQDLVLSAFKRALREHSESHDYVSQAKFQPSLPMQQLKPAKLKLARETFVLTEQFQKLGGGAGRYSRVVRRIWQYPAFARPLTKREDVYIAPKHISKRNRGEWHDELASSSKSGNRQKRLKWDKAKNDEFERWEKSMLRKVTRHRKVVLDAFKSIENGAFP